jgi:sorbitol-specific phosphotransferase system component IIC
MRYYIWTGLSGGVVGLGLSLAGLEVSWKFAGIGALIIFGTQICEAIAGDRP